MVQQYKAEFQDYGTDIGPPHYSPASDSLTIN